MIKGLKALQKIENELAKAWGMDIAYDEKVFDSFHIVGKELQALEIIIKKDVEIKYVKMSIDAEKRENNVNLFPAVGFYNRGQFDEDKCLTDNEFEIIREVIL